MKNNTLLALIILVIALSTKPQHGAANAAPEQVVDTSGKKLRVGVNYYIVPSPRNEYVGGLALASIGNNKECPLDVVPGFQAQPLTFTPLNPKKGVIRVSSDLNIAFSTYTTCPETTVWKINEYWFVTTGGVVGNPGWETVNNWFKIEKYEDSYKLVHCPSVCNDCGTPQCKDIGLYEGKYGTRLALSDVPYKVQFQLAA